MFDNARRYNQEGSSIYVDAEEMQKVFDATFNRLAVGSGLPGAQVEPAVALKEEGLCGTDMVLDDGLFTAEELLKLSMPVDEFNPSPIECLFASEPRGMYIAEGEGGAGYMFY